MEIFIYILLFIIWACFGSFGSVLISRLGWTLKWKKFKWVLYGRSHCPNCWYTLWWWDLFPIFSWLFLLWRCRKCKIDISWFYPAIEVLAWIIFMFSYYFTNQYLWYINYYDINYWIYLMFFTFINWMFVLFIMWDIKSYHSNDFLWLSLVAVIIFLQFIWIIWDFKLAFYGVLMFFWVFYFIYRFGIFYVRFRFWLKDTEWFWWWDVMFAYVVWLLFPFVVKFNWFVWEDYWYIVLMYILISAFLWIIFSMFWYIVRLWKQWQSIPFLPAMIVWFWVILYFWKHIVDFVKDIKFF